MIIGHLNLIRLVLLPLLLSIAVRQILPAEGIRRTTPASTGLYRPPQASTGLHMTLRIHRFTREMLVLNQSYFGPRARNGPSVRLVIAQAFHKRKRVRQNWSRPLVEKLSLFTFALAPLIRYSSSVVRHLSTVTKHVPCSEARIVHRMACFPLRYHFLFQSSLTRSCYPSVRLFGFFGVLCVCVFACFRVCSGIKPAAAQQAYYLRRRYTTIFTNKSPFLRN
jgi:hypothetical protein